MKRFTRRLMALLLAAVFCLTLLPGLALAEEPEGSIAPAEDENQATGYGQCGENLTWELTEDGVLTISGAGDMDNWAMSQAPWADDCESIFHVIVEEGTTGIGDHAFSRCDWLVNVELPSSLMRIGNEAFSECQRLERVTLPEGLKSIGAYAFSECFYLRNVTIPAKVSMIGNCAFYDCDSLIRIDVAGENAFFMSKDGVLFSKDGTELIQFPAGRSGDYQVPDGVNRICPYAFYSCSFLHNITLPFSLRYIDAYAFSSCSGLYDITLPEGLIRISRGAFKWTGIREITFPASLIEIYDSEGDVIYDDNGGSIFDGSRTENIYVSPDNPYYCSVDGVVFSKDKKELVMFPTGRGGSYAVPEGITSLAMRAFDSTILENLVLPESLTSIGPCAFQFARYLQSLRFKAGLKETGPYLFGGCGLNEVCFDGSAPAGIENSFQMKSMLIYYPADDPSWSPELREKCVANDYGGLLSWLPYVLGDIDSDGKLDLLDLVRLRKYLAADPVDVIRICSDLNGDCEVSTSDLVRLRKLLVGATE